MVEDSKLLQRSVGMGLKKAGDAVDITGAVRVSAEFVRPDTLVLSLETPKVIVSI